MQALEGLARLGDEGRSLLDPSDRIQPLRVLELGARELERHAVLAEGRRGLLEALLGPLCLAFRRSDTGAEAGGLRVDHWARARQGEVVELGCLGGHGRTGTALACLAVLAGTSPPAAVAWVRSAYCSQAVETPDQEAFVASLSV